MTAEAQTDDWTAPGAFEVAPGVFRVPLPLPNDGLKAVNVYVLRDPDGAITLVDSGWSIPEARELLVVALSMTAEFPEARWLLTAGLLGGICVAVALAFAHRPDRRDRH